MAFIKLKGETNTIQITAEQAEKASNIFYDVDVDMSQPMQIGSYTILKKDIRMIQTEDDTANYETKQESFDDKFQESIRKQREYRKQPAIYKAQKESWIKILHYVIKGTADVPEDIMEKSKEIAFDFFTENPKRTCVDPVLFKDVMGDIEINGEGPMKSNVRDCARKLIEQMVSRDIEDLKYA